MQLVIFLPTFNAPCMRRKIWCDKCKRKYFGLGWGSEQGLTLVSERMLMMHIVGCSSEEAASGVRVVLPASAVQRRPDRPAADTERQRRRPWPGRKQRVQDPTVGTATSNVGNHPRLGGQAPHTPGEHQLELMTLASKQWFTTVPLAVTPFSEQILILVYYAVSISFSISFTILITRDGELWDRMLPTQQTLLRRHRSKPPLQQRWLLQQHYI
jgi:hypothetical protein